MKFNSRTEAFSYALLLLTKLSRKQNVDQTIYPIETMDSCIHFLKVKMEDHEQNVSIINNAVNKL